jgi:adenylate cyclase
MLGLLIPVGGGDPIPLLKPTLIVGRRPSCDIRLNYPNVSSHHCRLEFVNGYWKAADVSTNGTKVNGERIDEKFLQPGDTVSFARHAFEIQYTPDPNAAPPTEEEEDPFAMSLLEKAGLLHRRDNRDRGTSRDRVNQKGNSSSRSGSKTNGSVPPKDPPKDLPPDDDDLALEWLKG